MDKAIKENRTIREGFSSEDVNLISEVRDTKRVSFQKVPVKAYLEENEVVDGISDSPNAKNISFYELEVIEDSSIVTKIERNAKNTIN